MKLQDAFASETGALGNWTNIGYVMKASASFTYEGDKVDAEVTCAEGTYDKTAKKCQKDGEGDDAGKKIETAVSGAAITKGWVAKNTAKLNDCDPGENWTISGTIGTAAANTGAVSYSSTIGSAACEQLTPSFAKISNNNTTGSSK